MSFKIATFNSANTRKNLTANVSTLAMLLVGSCGIPQIAAAAENPAEIPAAVTATVSAGIPAELPAGIPAAVSGESARKPSQVPLGDDVIVLSSRVFDIPFQMDASSAATRILLYVSRDQGQTWEIAANEPITVSRFHFQATEDGEHWFTTETNLAAQTTATSDPPAYARTPPQSVADTKRVLQRSPQRSPQRKIYVDTVGPDIRLNGGADLEGKVTLNLALTDAQKIASLRVLYATDVVREWKTVSNASIDAKGDFRFQPKEDWRQVSVHITATDLIGNASVEAKTFRRPRVATQPSRRLAKETSTIDLESLDPLPGRYKVFDDDASSTHVAIESNRTPDSVDAQIDNQLRVKAAAGPADPPSLIFGPQPGALTMNEARGNTAIGSGTIPNGPIQNELVPNELVPNEPRPSSRAKPTFGSAFDSFARQTLTKQAVNGPPTPSSTRVPDSTKTSATQSQQLSLPLTGLSAMTTPDGIEVVPAPAGEPAERATDLKPNSAAPPATTTPDSTRPGSTVELNKAPMGPRSLTDAMRPLEKQSPTSAAPEEIPAPTPSSQTNTETRNDRKRYQAEKAEQENLKHQRLFDRAQLASRVPIRHSDSNRFSLEYELEAIGNAGARAVELYGSLDGGKTWKRWGADPDRQSPFDIETKGEGLFSFRIVVLGNNGLASPRPLEGDTPDIAVLVDQTKPTLRVTSARYGEGDRIGSLVIRYECDDEHLMTRGIRVAFSDSLTGPWTTVAAGLRNDGLYVWPADPKLPRMIYLRLDATDQAGNVGTYILDQPIETQGLAPRAKILGFRTR